MGLGAIIHECNSIHPEESLSIPSCIACGIIMLKQSDIGIILKEWDDLPS